MAVNEHSQPSPVPIITFAAALGVSVASYTTF